jgi:hypothetical protein
MQVLRLLLRVPEGMREMATELVLAVVQALVERAEVGQVHLAAVELVLHMAKSLRRQKVNGIP